MDTVIVGGGDGSISSAGTVFVDSGKAMGVIPLGTFNLFARSLRIPIGFEAFLGALPDFRLEAIDTGCLTDRSGREHVFLHHVSLGMHPQFIEVREAMPYGSRVGKMLASMRVWGQTVRSLKQIPLSLGGDHVRPKARYYQAAVTVGSFREGFGDFPMRRISRSATSTWCSCRRGDGGTSSWRWCWRRSGAGGRTRASRWNRSGGS